jgi:alpha-ketoglutarate-dependent taurine dioxygenase
MTKLLEDAIATVRELPEPDQDVIAKFLLAYCNPEAQHYQLSAEQEAEVELARRDVREGKIATDAEMTQVWRRFGL